MTGETFCVQINSSLTLDDWLAGNSIGPSGASDTDQRRDYWYVRTSQVGSCECIRQNGAWEDRGDGVSATRSGSVDFGTSGTYTVRWTWDDIPNPGADDGSVVRSITVKVHPAPGREWDAYTGIVSARLMQNGGELTTHSFCVEMQAGVTLDQWLAFAQSANFRGTNAKLLDDVLHLIPDGP